ncbi:MAG: transporter substrate-binding domain-containing protein [Thermodesulfobacteriota bacterium]|nr:transporter substrate-binding domain-containing protein [Thermodesulfobacteriota bacterium]
MNRRLAWFLLALVLLCAAPVSAADAQSQERSIIIGTELACPPYSFLGENDEPVGFNVEVTRALARVTGLDVEIDYRPWGEIRDDLENGSIDVICGMYYFEERDRLVDFSQPITIVHHAAFARKGAKDMDSPQQLRGKKLIVMRGDIMHDLALEEGDKLIARKGFVCIGLREVL